MDNERCQSAANPDALLAFADDIQGATKFCTTIARAKMSEFIKRGFIPRVNDDTATVSFMDFEGKLYAVTAGHVIKAFQKMAEADDAVPEGYFLPASPGSLIEPPFVRPPARFPYPQPDIALRPIEQKKLPHGKQFYKLSKSSPKFPVSYALAAGFPTAAKEVQHDSGVERLKLAGVYAIAEGVGSSGCSDQLQFYSEVSREKISGDISGMSGGPVFWSDDKNYGLLGFVKEAMADTDASSARARVHFICQRADYDTFASWVVCADETFPKERAALNARIARATR